MEIKRSPKMLIYLKLLKKWGEYKPGDTAMFDERKGRPLIANGTAIELKKQEAKVETAVQEPAGETAEAPPLKEKKTKKKPGGEDDGSADSPGQGEK